MDELDVDLNSVSRLIPPCVDGDRDARDTLLRELEEFLYWLARNYSTESMKAKVGVSDIVQLSFVRIVENFSSFRGGSSKELKAWIKKIVANEVNRAYRDLTTKKRDFIRERTGEDPNGNADEKNWVDGEFTPHSNAIRHEQIEQFHQILAQMSSDQAEVIRLRCIEELSFSEVGKRMARSESAASQLWYRAMENFQEKLREVDGFQD
ncbi:MAG: sigma-70 family RNA polymerase sigma factor [Pirellulaceae bacterium]